MKDAELKALYIKRVQELTQRHRVSKRRALNFAYRPLIQEVTPLHDCSMAAAISVAIVYSELLATGEYGKKKK